LNRDYEDLITLKVGSAYGGKQKVVRDLTPAEIRMESPAPRL